MAFLFFFRLAAIVVALPKCGSMVRSPALASFTGAQWSISTTPHY
jgi:hypothetical protein